MLDARVVLATILRHDRKTASYKMALLRSINDVVIGYPDWGERANKIAVPLWSLAVFWCAYYWPFVSDVKPIEQGIHPPNQADISFRGALSLLKTEWEKIVHRSLPSDGFFLIDEFRTPRRRRTYPVELQRLYENAIRDIVNAIQQPLRYAGPGNYSVFERPRRWREFIFDPNVIAIPGTDVSDLCVLIDSNLWNGFRDLSLWIEALCIHEWCMFTEGLGAAERGHVYSLLTSRPDNRRPLTWERNCVDLSIMEGQRFDCPWTGKSLTCANYDLDHLIPISVYPLNEMWNIVPADREYNQHVKRDRLPSYERLVSAKPRLINTYHNYLSSPQLAVVLQQDVETRFDDNPKLDEMPSYLVTRVESFLNAIASV
jgi:hypothetical protein